MWPKFYDIKQSVKKLLINWGTIHRVRCHSGSFLGKNGTFSSLADNLSRVFQCFQHRKAVSLAPWYVDNKSFAPSALTKRIFGPKTAKFGPKLTLLAKYGHFWPIWSDARPKKTNNSNKLPWRFYRYVGTKTFTYSYKIRIFGQKMAKFGPKLTFLAKYWHFWPISSHARPKNNNKKKVTRWFFRYVGTKFSVTWVRGYQIWRGPLCPRTTSATLGEGQTHVKTNLKVS